MTVTVTPSTGQSFACDEQSDVPLLLQLEAHGHKVHYHCRAGFCGACRCKLVSGQIRYLQEPLAFVRRGEFLPCCSVPTTDISLEIPE
jgi:ferredoxin